MKKNIEIIKEYILGDMHLVWRKDKAGVVGLSLNPVGADTGISDIVDGCVQLKLEKDDFPTGFSNGHTLRNSQSTQDMCYKSFEEQLTENGHIFILETRNKKNLTGRQYVRYEEKKEALEVYTEYINNGIEELSLDMAASFSLEGVNVSEEPGEFFVHRLRSCWSNEGRLITEVLEDLQLEKSWSGYGARVERFGQIGSMPVRKYFPFVAAENREKGITWACKLGCPSSWQIEIYRRTEDICISGGIADYDFGHWKKKLKPGEVFRTPSAYISVCKGSVEEVCKRLLSIEKKGSFTNALPVIFNEFCTSWGNPSETAVNSELEILKEHDIDYFVIDAGWYSNENRNWESNMGDWIVNPELFPNGIKPVVKKITDAGMKPGIWFEVEVVGTEAKVAQESEHLLQRNGNVITVGHRRFWNMTDSWTQNYLKEKVTDFLKDYGFCYLKIDYNDSIGIGCDGAESFGEGLRQQLQASQDFYRNMKQKLPELKIEICSSGGHRLETSMMDIGDFASFSDAHEELEIPVIAANMHRMILPEKSEIWAVLRKEDSKNRLEYSLVNTFLGVMCLSGDIADLSEEQWECVDKAIAFYRKVSPIIINGKSEIFREIGPSYRHLTGWQAVVRYGEGKAMVIFHKFEDSCEHFSVPIKETYKTVETFGDSAQVEYSDKHEVRIHCKQNFSAVALLLIK